jgi:hypothetical protein
MQRKAIEIVHATEGGSSTRDTMENGSNYTRGHNTEKGRGTEIERYKGAELQRYGGTEAQRCRGTETFPFHTLLLSDRPIHCVVVYPLTNSEGDTIAKETFLPRLEVM